MIRINLLGAPKPKNKRAAASAAAVMEMGEVGSPKMKVLIVLGLAALLNLGYWYRLDRQKQDIAAKMQVADQRSKARLSGKKSASRPSGQSVHADRQPKKFHSRRGLEL